MGNVSFSADARAHGKVIPKETGEGYQVVAGGSE